jgi:hypothetical protein
MTLDYYLALRLRLLLFYGLLLHLSYFPPAFCASCLVLRQSVTYIIFLLSSRGAPSHDA